ncbi:unnamed protein product [Closterium sp. Yama58-4]|nr:unnamed protein product [Closterium sp. Yama58-4]
MAGWGEAWWRAGGVAEHGVWRCCAVWWRAAVALCSLAPSPPPMPPPSPPCSLPPSCAALPTRHGNCLAVHASWCSTLCLLTSARLSCMHGTAPTHSACAYPLCMRLPTLHAPTHSACTPQLCPPASPSTRFSLHPLLPPPASPSTRFSLHPLLPPPASPSTRFSLHPLLPPPASPSTSHLAAATLALSASALSATSAGWGPFHRVVPLEATLQVIGGRVPLDDGGTRQVGSAEQAERAAWARRVAVLEGEVQREREAARAAGEAVQAAVDAKVQFMANMSHEIRTPIHGILGMTDLALDSPLPPDAREHLETVLQSANHLLLVVNDILDITKLEAGRLHLDCALFDLRALLNGIMTMLAARAALKGLAFHWEVDAAVPPVLLGDAVRLRQCLVNLVGNAIKFTDQGKVHITVQLFSPSLLPPTLSLIPLPSSHSSPSSTVFPQDLTPSHLSPCNSSSASATSSSTTTTTLSSSAASACATGLPPSPSAPHGPSAARDDTDNEGHGGEGSKGGDGRGSEGAAAQGGEGVALLFTITDTGVGIARGEQKRIFCAFEQVDSSMSRQHGGTGLGLSITSRLVHMMGGSMWLHSSPGAGSTFAFSATFAAPPLSPCTPHAAVPRPRGARAAAPLSARVPTAARVEFSFPARPDDALHAAAGRAGEQGARERGDAAVRGEGGGMDASTEAAGGAGGGGAVQAVRRGEGRAGRSRRRTQSFTCGDASTGRMLEEVLRQASREQHAGQLPSSRLAAAGPHAHATAALAAASALAREWAGARSQPTEAVQGGRTEGDGRSTGSAPGSEVAVAGREGGGGHGGEESVQGSSSRGVEVPCLPSWSPRSGSGARMAGSPRSGGGMGGMGGMGGRAASSEPRSPHAQAAAPRAAAGGGGMDSGGVEASVAKLSRVVEREDEGLSEDDAPAARTAQHSSREARVRRGSAGRLSVEGGVAQLQGARADGEREQGGAGVLREQGGGQGVGRARGEEERLKGLSASEDDRREEVGWRGRSGWQGPPLSVGASGWSTEAAPEMRPSVSFKENFSARHQEQGEPLQATQGNASPAPCEALSRGGSSSGGGDAAMAAAAEAVSGSRAGACGSLGRQRQLRVQHLTFQLPEDTSPAHSPSTPTFDSRRPSLRPPAHAPAPAAPSAISPRPPVSPRRPYGDAGEPSTMEAIYARIQAQAAASRPLAPTRSPPTAAAAGDGARSLARGREPPALDVPSTPSSSARRSAGGGLLRQKSGGLALLQRQGTGVGRQGGGLVRQGTGLGRQASVKLKQKPVRAASPRAMLSVTALNILLADDSVVNQKVAVRFLKKKGMVADAVGDGAQAIQRLYPKDGGISPYDLLLLDVQMPVMDGLQTVRVIREKETAEKLPHLPVIGLTAHAADVYRDQCISAGMDGFVSKPFTVNQLLSMMQSVLEKYSHKRLPPEAMAS